MDEMTESTQMSRFPVVLGRDHDITYGHVEQISEIFRTPLTGSFVWDYETADIKLRRLYELGKKLNWNAEIDIDWSIELDRSKTPFVDEFNPFIGFPEYESLSSEKKVEFDWHRHSWALSQFLHGEQGALLVASQLVSCAPTQDGKFYAASQTFDEARHVEVFGKYVREKIGFMYPINPNLKTLLDKILTDERWDLKFIGMQIIIEGLALAAFTTIQKSVYSPLLREIVSYVIADEARHVSFGVIYLEQVIKTLSDKEVEERAQFAYEACVIMRDRLFEEEIFEAFALDFDRARDQVFHSHVMSEFRNTMFTRIIPNLRKIGLLTDTIRPLFEELGILKFENLPDDGTCLPENQNSKDNHS